MKEKDVYDFPPRNSVKDFFGKFRRFVLLAVALVLLLIISFEHHWLLPQRMSIR